MHRALLLFLLLLLCIVVGAGIGLALLELRPASERPAYEMGVAKVFAGKFEEGKQLLEELVAQGPPNADAHYWIGAAWQGLGQHAKAIDAFQEALRVDETIAEEEPSSQEMPLQRDPAEVYLRLGASYLELRKYEDAVRELTTAIRSIRNDATAYCKRGIAFQGEGFPELAAADFHAALLIDPEYVDALLHHAQVLLEMGDYVRARKDAQHAVRAKPDSAEGYCLLGCGLLLDGKYAMATSHFSKAERIDPKLASVARSNIAVAEALARGDTQKPLVRFDADGLPNVFLTTAARIDEPKPSETPAAAESRPPDAEAHFQKALSHRDSRQWSDAVSECTAALAIYNNDAEAYCLRGIAFIEQGFPDTAIKDFQQAMRLRRHYAEACRQQVRARLLLEDWSLAIEDCTELIRRDPNDARAYLLRGRAYLGSGDFDRALADLRQAERLDPKCADEVKPAVAETLKGQGLKDLRAKQWDAAIQGLQQAIALRPEYADPLNRSLAEAHRGRGQDRAKQGDLAEALVDLNEAIRLEPADADNFRSRGETYLKSGQWDAAIADFTKAVDLEPGRAFRVRPSLAEAHYRRGLASRQAGQTTQAEADFSRARQLGWETL